MSNKSDAFIVEIVKYDGGLQKLRDGSERDYVKMAGYGKSGKWCKLIIFDDDAKTVEGTLRSISENGELKDRVVMQVSGNWVERAVKKDGDDGLMERFFWVERYSIRNGVEREMVLLRRDAYESLMKADKFREMSCDVGASQKRKYEDLLVAYQSLERFVSSLLKMGQPSLTDPEDREYSDSLVFSDPEELARNRLDIVDKGGVVVLDADCNSSTVSEEDVSGTVLIVEQEKDFDVVVERDESVVKGDEEKEGKDVNVRSIKGRRPPPMFK